MSCHGCDFCDVPENARLHLRVVPFGDRARTLHLNTLKFYELSQEMEWIAKWLRVPRSQLEFTYHGHRVRSDFAPADYGMRNKSTIYVSRV